MPLSKARDRARKRLERGGYVLPSSNLAISYLPPDTRKEVLTQIALHAIEKPVTAGHKIAAIKELNLMEHVYDEKPQYNDNRTYNILVTGDDIKPKLNQLLAGKRELPQQLQPQDVVLDMLDIPGPAVVVDKPLVDILGQVSDDEEESEDD